MQPGRPGSYASFAYGGGPDRHTPWLTQPLTHSPVRPQCLLCSPGVKCVFFRVEKFFRHTRNLDLYPFIFGLTEGKLPKTVTKKVEALIWRLCSVLHYKLSSNFECSFFCAKKSFSSCVASCHVISEKVEGVEEKTSQIWSWSDFEKTEEFVNLLTGSAKIQISVSSLLQMSEGVLKLKSLQGKH